MPPKEKVFTKKKRRVYRNVIPRSEVIFGGCFVAFLIVAGMWVLSTHDNFDPGERDISIEVMEQSAVEDTLYRAPLERWVDPTEVRADTGEAPVVRLGIFPQSLLEGGWTPSTRVQEFDESNLFEKINGAAPQYFQYGFERMHFVGMSKADSDIEINIELYDMGRLPNAMGIFAAQRDDSQSLVKAGDLTYYYLTSAGALGLIDRFYFKITGNSSSQEILDKSVQLVESLTDLSSSGGSTPKLFQVFHNRLDIPFERIRYATKDAFQYAFAQDFWFARPESESEDMNLYAHEARSAEEATSLFDKLLENHLYDFTLVEQSDTAAVLKHNFLETLLSLSWSGNFIYGVDGAPNESVLRQSAASLGEALFDDEEE